MDAKPGHGHWTVGGRPVACWINPAKITPSLTEPWILPYTP
jgi:hypothetical protein